MTEEYNGKSDSSELQRVIEQVRSELKEQNGRMLITRKEVVIKLGKAFEGEVSEPEWICEEIKNVLKKEILLKIISHRDIERYSLPHWKKKTKPKKEKENDNLSFSKEKNVPVMTVATNRKVILESQGHFGKDENIPDVNSEDVDEVEYNESREIENSTPDKDELNNKNSLEFELSFP